MKKYSLPFFVVLLFGCSIARAKERKPPDPFSDSLKVIRQQIRALDSSNTVIISRMTDNLKKMKADIAELKAQQGSLSWKDFITWIFSLGALFISFYVLTREGKYKRLAFLSEVDKLFVNDPSLWRVYDDYNKEYDKVSSKASPPQTPKDLLDQEGKLRGFIYFLLNNFELTLPKRNLFNRDKTNSWEQYFQELVQGSSRFRKIVADSTTNLIFNPRFRQKLKTMLKAAGYKENGTLIMPLQTPPSAPGPHP